MDHISNIDLPQSDASAYRSGNARVHKVQLYVINLGLVGADSSIELALKRALGIELLFGNYAIFIELLKSLQVQPGIFERGLVFEASSLGLAQLHFIRARVNFRQQLAFLYLLPLFYVDLDQLAI